MTQEEKIEILSAQALHAIRLSGEFDGGPIEDCVSTMMRHGLALITMAEMVEDVHDAQQCFAHHFNVEYGVFWKSDAEAMHGALDSMLENLPEEIAEKLVERFYLIPTNDPGLRHAS